MKYPLTILFYLFSILSATAQKDQPVKIGLLIQDKNCFAAKQGAELAIQQANEKGGLNGRPFQLVVKSMEGPWGTGSKQAIDLIFEDQVWALLGSHDGRNGHLVEQAATKSIVVFVSAWSSDPTLTQAFVPWLYNAVPTDIQQAKILCEDIFDRKNISGVAIVSDQSYDSRQSVKGFIRVLDQSAKGNPSQFVYEDYSGNHEKLAEDIKKSGAGAIVFLCQPAISFRIIALLKQKKTEQVMYSSILSLSEDILSANQLKLFDGVLVTAGKFSAQNLLQFSKLYNQTYNRQPGLAALYSYDAANILIEAIKKSGRNEREVIEESISGTQFKCITGHIKFDNLGNRSDDFQLFPLRNGLPWTTTN